MTLFQIWYKEKHKEHIFPFATPYENTGLTIFFENDVISKLVSEFDGDRIGVCSWKLATKVRKHQHPSIEKALNSDYQVLSFTRKGERHMMMAAAKEWHKDFLPAITMLWQKLGLQMPGEAKYHIYSNHFVAKTEVYRDYVTNFLNPAMELIKTDPELNEIMMRPSGYERLSSEADVRSVKEKLGIDFFPLAPFVLERCPALWFTMKRIPVNYL